MFPQSVPEGSMGGNKVAVSSRCREFRGRDHAVFEAVLFARRAVCPDWRGTPGRDRWLALGSAVLGSATDTRTGAHRTRHTLFVAAQTAARTAMRTEQRSYATRLLGTR